MGTLTALLAATPIFGMALAPPPGALSPAAITSPLPPAQVAAGVDVDPTPGEEADEDVEVGGDDEMADYAATLRERSEVASIHRPLGIATWAAMGVTVLLGGIQYHNLYGLGASLDETPCVTGDAIFGQGQCSGTPWPHLISAFATTGLYAATFITSLMMPDPDGGADEGDSEYAQTLRTHKLLRWVHFGGMVAQIALGILIANSDRFGLDRANDYGTLQALSTVHMGIGIVTWGAMTWAGALMVL